MHHATTADPLGRGDAIVTYTLHNTGNTVVSAQQTVRVSGPFGWFSKDAAPATAAPGPAAGESWPVSVTVPGVVGSGRLSAAVAVTPVVIDASGSTSSLSPVEGSAHGWAVPWVLLVMLVVAAAVVVLAVRGVRRGRGRRRAREEARVEEAVAEALCERAEAGSAG